MNTMIKVTNNELSTDWERINSMRFDNVKIYGTIGQPRDTYLRPHTEVTVTFPGSHQSYTHTTGDEWGYLSGALAAMRGNPDFKEVKEHVEGLKSYKPRRNAMCVTTHGIILDRKPKSQLRPLTKAENQRLINRNRARLGLAPLTFA